jgi:Terminase-like family.
MGLRLHRTQSKVFESRERYRTLVAGRRWGKTWLAAAELARGVQEAGVGPWRFWYIAPTYREARDIFWNDIKRAMYDLRWVRGEPNETRLEIELVTGAQIALKGADKPNALRGRGLKGVVFDEFATMKPETWTEAIRPALADHQGWAVFIGTPQSFNHLFDMYQRGQDREPGYASWQFKTIEGAVEPWGPLTAEEIESARRDMDERSYRQEFEASFEAVSGRIYYAFDRAENVAPVALSPDITACISFDFNIDPATAVIGWRDGDYPRVYREVFLSHRGGEATLACARKVKQILEQANHQGPLRIYGDSTGDSGKTTGPSDHAVLRAEFPGATWCIPGSQPHTKDRYAAVNARCKSALGNRYLRVDPTCVHLVADLEQVVFNDKGVEDQDTNPMLTHVSAALGYWLVRDFPPVHLKNVGFGRMEHLL